MTTPFEMRLESELNVEFGRFDSEWLFHWHNINIPNRTVDVDDFKGGRITSDGIVFEGQIQQIYWRTIERYLEQKIHNAMSDWDVSTKKYPADLRKASLDGTEFILRYSVDRIVRHATDTDRRLRGNGYPNKIQPYNSTAIRAYADAQIVRLKEAHSKLIPDGKNERLIVPAKTFREKADEFIGKYKNIMGLITLIATLTFGLLRLFGLV